MLRYPKPKIVFSTCLGFSPVRYDGNVIFDNRVEELKKYVEPITVCPEVGIGLGIPRNPLILYREGLETRLVDTATGIDLSQIMASFASKFLDSAGEVDGFLLKSASPSCGVGDSKVYGAGRRVVGRTDGLFVKMVKNALPLIPVESEKRLQDQHIRRNFYTRIFTLARVRESLEKAATTEDVVDLHRSLKYLLMLYHPGIMRELGRIVASRKQLGIDELRREYKVRVMKALTRRVSNKSYADVFTHMYGHLKHHLTGEERQYVLSMIHKLIQGREDVRTVLAYFKGFRYRLGSKYLAEQTFLQPYPEELDETDASRAGH